MNQEVLTSGENEVMILVKTASQQSKKQDEILYSTGITDTGELVRLFPLISPFQKELPKFKRWDRIRFKWKRPTDDPRPESLRIDPATIRVLGEVPQSERAEFINKAESGNLSSLVEAGRSLALFRPQKPIFSVQRKSEGDILYEVRVRQQMLGLPVNPDGTGIEMPFPYKFKYRFSSGGHDQEAEFHDWEMRDTLTNLSKSLGDAQALSRIIQLWGKEYPHKGVLFPMSRETLTYPTWSINSIICTDEFEDMAAHAINLIA